MAGSKTAATTAPASPLPGTSATRSSRPDHGPHDHAAMQRADDAHGGGHGGHAGMSMDAMARDMRNRFLVALVFTIPIVLWSMVGTSCSASELATPFGIDRDVWQFLLSLPIVLYASSIFFTGAVAALRNRTLDMMVLVAVAIGTAWLYSVAATFFIEGEVFYESAGMLATFVLLGHWFEMRARGGANDAVRALLDLAPPKAVVLRDGEPVEVPTAEVEVGDLLLIRPGSKVAVDATVEEGESQVDESTVTGESLPVKKTAGDQLIGATINKNGTLRARATAVGSDTALAQIVKLVQEAQNSKAPGQRLADRAAFWLVLVALVGGTLTFVVWYFVVGRDVQESLLFAITVVVITCPDALGLATPTAIMVGTGLGAKRGILFKHAMALEQAASLDTVVLDKTGTLTRGEPEVVAVATADGVDEDEVLRLVAAAEGDSEHPLAEAIVKAAADARPARCRAPRPSRPCPATACSPPSTATASPSATPRLLEREGIARDGLAARSDELAGEGRTSVQVAIDGKAAAVIAIADAPRETAAEADRRAQGARRPAGHALRRQPRHRRTRRRRARHRRGHRRGASRRQGRQGHRAPAARPQGRDGRRRRQRRPRARPGRRRHRHRRRHRRRRRDRRRRAHALRPARRRHRHHHQPRHQAQDAPEPRLGRRLQQPRAARSPPASSSRSASCCAPRSAPSRWPARASSSRSTPSR